MTPTRDDTPGGQAGASVVRRYMDAFLRGDRDAAFELLAEDVVWHIPGRSMLAGEHRGRGGFAEAIDSLVRATDGSYRIELQDLLAGERYAAVVVDASCRRAERDLSWRRVALFRVEDGRIAEEWLFEEDQYAVDAHFGEPGGS